MSIQDSADADVLGDVEVGNADSNTLITGMKSEFDCDTGSIDATVTASVRGDRNQLNLNLTVDHTSIRTTSSLGGQCPDCKADENREKGSFTRLVAISDSLKNDESKRICSHHHSSASTSSSYRINVRYSNEVRMA
eukprot:CAMPEP_0116985346 /NCGR_PEP_ID=MMETSP0467-20121206/62191_1 /TAXON_ID=283647 /ORGANISM="Mesodinium pulex, Strain SPMC105" /LENGTH=135 /DNA_ID=CAMNT_0004680627 /DNA_START=1804 /DNA_END=2211 /DNA_ORIENTATION=-